MKIFKPKITPGPWVYDEEDSEISHRVRVDCDAPIWVIAMPGGLNTDSSKANLKAIAALPKLLNLLSHCRRLRQDLIDYKYGGMEFLEFMAILDVLDETHGEEPEDA